MQRFEDADYREFADLLRACVAAQAPGWVDSNDSDPGIALIELFAFLTQSLLQRSDAIPERGRASAARLAKFAALLADRGAPVATCALARPRYFAGQLLGVDDLTLEQDYFRQRLRRLNRELHGYGVARGLHVSVDPGSGAGARVVVTPGFALSPYGEEIEVCEPQTIGLPEDGGCLYVVLLHSERPTASQPVTNGTEFTRVEERFAIRLEPAPVADAVTLARMLREAGGWRVDAEFAAARAAKLAT
jgi:hypothetical protein